MSGINEREIPMRRLSPNLLLLLLLAVCTCAFAADQEADPCDDWRQSASETMFRVASAQSSAEEGINLLRDLLERHNAGEAGALALLKRQRKRFEPMVEEAVAASGLAAGEAERLKQLLKGAVLRCPDEELHGMRYTQWWFENHGPIVKMLASYLAAVRLDFKKAKSILEEIIASNANSDSPNIEEHIGRAARWLKILQSGEIPSRHRRQFNEQANPGKVPPPQHIPEPEGAKP